MTRSPVRSWSTAQTNEVRIGRLSKQRVLLMSRRERRNQFLSADKNVRRCPDNNFLTEKLLVAGDPGQRLLYREFAKVAQLVEHRFRKAGVVGPIPTFGSAIKENDFSGKFWRAERSSAQGFKAFPTASRFFRVRFKNSKAEDFLEGDFFGGEVVQNI